MNPKASGQIQYLRTKLLRLQNAKSKPLISQNDQLTSDFKNRKYPTVSKEMLDHYYIYQKDENNTK